MPLDSPLASGILDAEGHGGVPPDRRGAHLPWEPTATAAADRAGCRL